VSAHTPGPWATNSKYGNSKRVPIVREGRSDREALAWVDADDVPEEESQANVALIAAAPELLEAAEEVDALIESLWKSVPWGATFNLDAKALNEAPPKLKRAIAKAKGVTP